MTSVDMAVLAGGNTEACYAKYGTMPTKVVLLAYLCCFQICSRLYSLN